MTNYISCSLSITLLAFFTFINLIMKANQIDILGTTGIGIVVNTQSQSESLNSSTTRKRAFLFNNNDYFGVADFSGTPTELNVKTYVYFNFETSVLLENGFYIGIGFGTEMAGSNINLFKFYSSQNRTKIIEFVNKLPANTDNDSTNNISYRTYVSSKTGETYYYCFELKDSYVDPKNKRVIVSDTDYADGIDNDFLNSGNVYLDLTASTFSDKHMIYVDFTKYLADLDNYDRSDLADWSKGNIPLIAAFGLLDEKYEMKYHLVRSTSEQVYLKDNSNSGILNYSYSVNWKSLSTNLTYTDNSTVNEEGNVTYVEYNDTTTIEYYSDSTYTDVPFKNFKELLKYKNDQEKYHIYLICDGSLTPDIFLMTVLSGNSTYIKGTTYLLDSYETDLLANNGLVIGIVFGTRIMANGDFVIMQFKGTNMSNKNQWIAYDAYASTTNPRDVLEDSIAYINDNTNATDGTYLSDISNSSDYNNVNLLTGDNISPVWFNLGSNNTKAFGKFKNMWVFNWEKIIPTAIDKYDWSQFKYWKDNFGYISAAVSYGTPEGNLGYHGSSKAAYTNLKNGSGLRSNTLAIYDMSYLNSRRLRIYFSILFIIITLI